MNTLKPDLDQIYHGAIMRLDSESRAVWKIHRVLGHHPELGLGVAEVIAEFEADLADIGDMSLQHLYRLLSRYAETTT